MNWLPITIEVAFKDNYGSGAPSFVRAIHFNEYGEPDQVLVEYDRYISSSYGGSSYQRALTPMTIDTIFPGNLPDHLRAKVR